MIQYSVISRCEFAFLPVESLRLCAGRYSAKLLDWSHRLGKRHACRYIFQYEAATTKTRLNHCIASKVTATVPLENFSGEMT